MPRKPQVTRTLLTTKVKLMCLDVKEEKTFYHDMTLSRVFKDDNAILKAANNVINDNDIKAVHVVKAEVVKTHYSMTEERFIQLADVISEKKK